MADATLVRGKLEQARNALDELNIDLWITYCRETTQIGEPAASLLLDQDIVMPTLVFIPQNGTPYVITGCHDAPAIEELGCYDVFGYDFDEPIRPAVREYVAESDPESIAVNSADQLHAHIADGLTDGLRRRLVDMLERPYTDRLESAYELICRLRSVKTPVEYERMLEAAELTEEILAVATADWQESWGERAFVDRVHCELDERGLGTAWSRKHCPGVNVGAGVEIGRRTRSDDPLDPGEVLHVDFGVKTDGYSTDLQRVYYRRQDSSDEGPEELRDALLDVRAALDAARDKLEPGVSGHEVDAAARGTLLQRGWPEPDYGVGHTVGRNAHDGGTLLGPRWHHFGEAVERQVLADELYALEFGVQTEYGFVGLEDVVSVDNDGARYLVEPQQELRYLPV